MYRISLGVLVMATLQVLGYPAVAAGQQTVGSVAGDPGTFLPRPDECATLVPDRQQWWKQCSGRTPAPAIPFNRLPGYILGGRLDVWSGAPDFYLSQENRYWGAGLFGHEGTPKFYTRSLVLADKGDTPDLAIRRAGPDMGGPYGEPQPVPAGQGLGTIYWQAWGQNCLGGYGWYSGCGGFGRVAEIWAGTVGDQTAASRAGALHFNTTPVGNPGNSLLRFTMTENGQFVAHSGGTPAAPAITLNQTGTGLTMTPQTAALVVDKLSVLTARVPARNAQTSLTLLIRRVDGTTRESDVEVGDPDSCGTGYRCLRVPN